MKHILIAALALILIRILALPLTAQEKHIKKTDVPKAVLASFERAYPNAKVNGYASEEMEKTICYELESVDGKIHRDILYSADGTVLEVEEGMMISELPEAVRDAVKKDYPKGIITSAEKLTKGETTQYEVVVKHDKAKTEMKLDPTGKSLEKE